MCGNEMNTIQVLKINHYHSFMTQHKTQATLFLLLFTAIGFASGGRCPTLALSLWWLSPPDNLSLWRYFLNFKMLSNYIIPCRE
jgi:hypothetical protein